MTQMAGERVSPSQVMVLFALSRFTISLVYYPAVPQLKQDVWIIAILGALWGIPFAWVPNLLWQRFPGQTFVEVLEIVLGKAVSSGPWRWAPRNGSGSKTTGPWSSRLRASLLRFPSPLPKASASFAPT
jgi:hypothetical protein